MACTLISAVQSARESRCRSMCRSPGVGDLRNDPRIDPPSRISARVSVLVNAGSNILMVCTLISAIRTACTSRRCSMCRSPGVGDLHIDPRIDPPSRISARVSVLVNAGSNILMVCTLISAIRTACASRRCSMHRATSTVLIHTLNYTV